MDPTGRSFSTRRGRTRIVFGRGARNRLAAELEALGLRRAAILSTPGRRADAEALAAALGGRAGPVLATAREHVPVETVGEALAALGDVDGLVAYGGGSAIGLAKAVALESKDRLHVAAVPTTYSGSEMTSMFGITSVVDGRATKRTGRDERARPSLVVYDPDLTAKLPKEVAVASAWNAIAHAVEAIWAPGVDRGTLLTAEEALRLLAAGLLRLGGDDPRAGEEVLEGAFLAGAVVGDVNGGIHHKLCHVLGGSFAMPHAATHAALLPHVVRWVAEGDADGAVTGALARALGVVDPVRGVAELAAASGAPQSLTALGFDRKEAGRVIDAVLAAPPPSPRVVDRAALEELLASAAAERPARPAAAPLRAPARSDRAPFQGGFGSVHASEALEGAIPRTQNTPRPAPYGLYPELLSGTPFTTRNALNTKVWMYRIRPSFSHGPFRPLPQGNFTFELGEVQVERTRWRPLPIPGAPARVDFLDGLVTMGGDGSLVGPGYSVSMYAANADMVDRAFSSADGDLLLVPQSGTVDLRTELGFLRVPPGSFALVPRGIKFAVGLPDGHGRGWLTEVYGPRFRLPERGPVGSNGLADARHFIAPEASYEDRLCPNGFEIVHKTGGRLHAALQEHSPFDVVGWQGVHVPLVYDLMMFNAMGSNTFDHADPSIHTVLTTPYDDHGRAIVDFVVFRGRWDVAEHSFRPPFMHRNAASEINGVVKVKSVDDGYEPGCMFVSPLLTAHGITTKGYKNELDSPDDKHEGARRLSDQSLWVMFESSLPFRLTRFARTTPLLDRTFRSHFEGMPSRFTPHKR